MTRTLLPGTQGDNPAQLFENTAGSSPPRPAQVQAYAGSSAASPPSPRSSGANVSTMTADSSKYSAPSDASTAAGWGPWAYPPGCSEIEPTLIPDPLRAS